MEIEVFLWTGRIVWWIVCITTVIVAVAAGVIAPTVAYTRVKKRVEARHPHRRSVAVDRAVHSVLNNPQNSKEARTKRGSVLSAKRS